MRQLLLYTSAGCHLCEQALAVVEPLLAQRDLDLVQVEIADSDELIERYGVRIPVLLLEGADRDLGWPFDRADFLGYIEQCQ